jgi:NADH-quinone oxidoreductase subunit C
VLICISGIDYPENLYRFKLAYELLSIQYNTRLRFKIVLDEMTPVNSIETIFVGSTWWECEIWDMFGIFFLNHSNITRLLTDYGFQGYPLKKDFPLVGFTESRYNIIQNRVVYENVEFAQVYRVFDYMSPWENFN